MVSEVLHFLIDLIEKFNNVLRKIVAELQTV